MKYQDKINSLQNAIVAELSKIEDRPTDWLPHTVFVEEEGDDTGGGEIPVYTMYKLLDFTTDGRCQLLEVATNEVRSGMLYEINIDWLVTVLSYYEDLTGREIVPVEDTFVDIAFHYAGELYTERIHTSQIDPEHYENIWDYWWGAGKEDPLPDLTFEVTADKNENGQFLTANMYINVYEHPDDNHPIATIEKVACRKSWINRKSFI